MGLCRGMTVEQFATITIYSYHQIPRLLYCTTRSRAAPKYAASLVLGSWRAASSGVMLPPGATTHPAGAPWRCVSNDSEKGGMRRVAILARFWLTLACSQAHWAHCAEGLKGLRPSYYCFCTVPHLSYAEARRRLHCISTRHTSAAAGIGTLIGTESAGPESHPRPDVILILIF